MDPIVFGISENLRAVASVAVDDPSVVFLCFQARVTEEEIKFKVTTSSPIKEARWIWSTLHGAGPQFFIYDESFAEFHYSIFIDRKFLDHDFLIAIKFDTPNNPISLILTVEIWPKSEITPQMVCFDFSK